MYFFLFLHSKKHITNHEENHYSTIIIVHNDKPELANSHIAELLKCGI